MNRTMPASEQSSAAFHRPCALNPLGVSAGVCLSVTSVLFHNLTKCSVLMDAGTQGCKSPLRLCRACLLQGFTDEQARVTDPAGGLCDFHAQNGEIAKRSKKTRFSFLPSLTPLPLKSAEVERNSPARKVAAKNANEVASKKLPPAPKANEPVDWKKAVIQYHAKKLGRDARSILAIADAVKTMKELGMKHKDIAHAFLAKSDAAGQVWASTMYGLRTIGPEVREQICSGGLKVPFSKLKILAKQPREKQMAFLQRAEPMILG